jgi:hypothetical protein
MKVFIKVGVWEEYSIDDTLPIEEVIKHIENKTVYQISTESEYILETTSQLEFEQNYGRYTVEVTDDNGDTLWNNIAKFDVVSEY